MTDQLRATSPHDAADHDDVRDAGRAAPSIPPSAQNPRIDDVPPRRVHDFGDLFRAVGAVILAALVMLSSIYLSGITTGVESDAHTAGQALNWMVDLDRKSTRLNSSH